MGGCGSKPEQRRGDDTSQAAQTAGVAAAPGAVSEPAAIQAAVHSDIVNDVVRGGSATEIISSSEDGSCVLYDWRRSEVVRLAADQLSSAHGVRMIIVSSSVCPWRFLFAYG